MNFLAHQVIFLVIYSNYTSILNRVLAMQLTWNISLFKNIFVESYIYWSTQKLYLLVYKKTISIGLQKKKQKQLYFSELRLCTLNIFNRFFVFQLRFKLCCQKFLKLLEESYLNIRQIYWKLDIWLCFLMFFFFG